MKPSTAHLGILVLSLAVLAPSVPARANLPIEAGEAATHTPIPFVPFTLSDFVNPDTGLPYAADDLVPLPPELQQLKGRATVKMSDLLAELNQMRQHLNGLGIDFNSDPGTRAILRSAGFSLEDLDAGKPLEDRIASVDAVVQDRAALLKRKLEIEAMHRPLDGDNYKALTPEALEKAIEERLKQRGADTLLDLYRLSQESPIHLDLPSLPSLPGPFKAPKVDLSVHKSKDWHYEIGDKALIAAGARANLKVDADTSSALLTADGHLSGYIINKEVEIARVNGQFGKRPDGSKAETLDFWAVSEHKPSLESATVEKPAVGTREDYSLPEIRTKIPFTIGPIPCSVTYGVRGSAFWQWRAGVSPLQATIGVYPGVESSAFAELGVDVAVAAAGVGGDLVLLKDQLNVEGSAQVSLAEDASPAIEFALTGTNSLTALAGRLYAYIKVWLIVTTEQWDIDLFNWSGLSLPEQNIFKYSKKMTVNGSTAEGDLSADDIAELERENTEAKLRQAEARVAQDEHDAGAWIAQDLISHADTLQEAARLEAGNAAVRDEFAAYLMSLRQ